MKPDYTIQVALAGDAVAKAADAHMRALRGLLLSGKMDLTGDAETCEMIAAGMKRLEDAIAAHKAIVKG